jgi:ABC-2 type transport system ATP-binding protein
LANRIGIIHQGRLILEMDVTELEQNRQRRLLVKARNIEAAQRELFTAGFNGELLHDETLEFNQTSAIQHPDEIARILVEAGTPPTQLLIDEEDLEQYFLRLVGTKGDSK